MRYLIIKTDVRTVAPDELSTAWTHGQCLRDERVTPERRRQTMFAEDREAAIHLARALSAVGPVRDGRQRIKVVQLGAALPRAIREQRPPAGNHGW